MTLVVAATPLGFWTVPRARDPPSSSPGRGRVRAAAGLGARHARRPRRRLGRALLSRSGGDLSLVGLLPKEETESVLVRVVSERGFLKAGKRSSSTGGRRGRGRRATWWWRRSPAICWPDVDERRAPSPRSPSGSGWRSTRPWRRGSRRPSRRPSPAHRAQESTDETKSLPAAAAAAALATLRAAPRPPRRARQLPRRMHEELA